MSAVTQPVVTTRVRYFYPGTFFSEESSRDISARDPALAAREAPDGAFAFEMSDRVTETASIDGREVELRSDAINVSGRYYIDAEPMNAAAVRALPGDHSILLSNMRANRWHTILRCRAGNFQPLEDGDVLISCEGEIRS